MSYSERFIFADNGAPIGKIWTPDGRRWRARAGDTTSPVTYRNGTDAALWVRRPTATGGTT